MRLYNTLTRQIEPFEPLNETHATLYSCGPTVYDYYHIGNLRNAVFNDTLRRTLEVCRFKPHHVMNITDVGHLVSDADEGEDKLEKGAAREGKSVWEVAKHYTDAFKADMAALHVLPPNGYHSKKYDDTYARATEFIDQQVALIQTLQDKGFAYQTEQAIYFDVTKLPDYGRLSGQNLADKEVAVRSEVVTDKEKRHPFDFAVWFFAVGHFAGHSMKWPSPWGEGFPGWHLECSAIIHGTLGDPIDIHTGGVDHIGTHHPNEMAQTQAAYGNQLASYWIHNEFILVDGAKMSKSKQNSYTLQDVTAKGFDAMALRLLYLQAHYRSELNFTWENLAAAQNRLRTIQAFADLRHQADPDAKPLPDDYFVNLVASLKLALENDLNTPEVLKILSEAITHVGTYGHGIHEDRQADFVALLKFLDSTLGLGLSEQPDINAGQKQLLEQRAAARRAKDWGASDKLREALAEQSIGVNDTPSGGIWYRL